LSFLSVAIWWALFSIPLFLRVPEPPAVTAKPAPGENVVRISFDRLWTTLKDIRRYRELFKYLIAFLIYNDGIGTIIGVAAIYGAELGFDSLELILALLLVQFVGIPFSLVFGRLPSKGETRRPLFLAFILFNVIALPLVGIAGRFALPTDVTGAPQAAFEGTELAVGQGLYLAEDPAINYAGSWLNETVSAARAGTDADVLYRFSSDPQAQYDFSFNGQKVEITYSTGPDRGIWAVRMDGEAYLDPDTGEPLRIDAHNQTVRYAVRKTLDAGEPGQHTLILANTGEADSQSEGTLITVSQIEVLDPARHSNLGLILGFILALEAVGILFAWTLGRRLFSGLAEMLDTRRSIILALVVYAIIAIWGYFLNSTIEFWLLAWMVAMVQGGSQALSRSLYASMSPAAKSGEFFGLYGVMEKFSAIIGPLLFAAAATIFDSSRPAVLSLIVLFVVGVILLRRVDVAEGRRVAHEEDAAALGTSAAT
jgi:MFS-type transporter involved in bile tolerance (Atg22 family)